VSMMRRTSTRSPRRSPCLSAAAIYSLLDMHQDAWTANLAARPDEDCPEIVPPAIGWDGAPDWATFDEGKPRCVPGGFRDLTQAVTFSWRAFFRNEEGPGGIGIRTRYARMLGHVAERFAGSTAIAGYDVMNEPGVYSDVELEGLVAMYADAIVEIRAGERRAPSWRAFAYRIFRTLYPLGGGTA
jgi:endoglycosylceramidase